MHIVLEVSGGLILINSHLIIRIEALMRKYCGNKGVKRSIVMDNGTQKVSSWKEWN